MGALSLRQNDLDALLKEAPPRNARKQPRAKGYRRSQRSSVTGIEHHPLPRFALIAGIRAARAGEPAAALPALVYTAWW